MPQHYHWITVSHDYVEKYSGWYYIGIHVFIYLIFVLLVNVNYQYFYLTPRVNTISVNYSVICYLSVWTSYRYHRHQNMNKGCLYARHLSYKFITLFRNPLKANKQSTCSQTLEAITWIIDKNKWKLKKKENNILEGQK